MRKQNSDTARRAPRTVVIDGWRYKGFTQTEIQKIEDWRNEHPEAKTRNKVRPV